MKASKALKQLMELKKYNSSLRLAAEGWDADWKTLISTLLSARTRDEKTIEVSKVLYKKFPSVEKLAEADFNEVDSIIRQVNYHKTKTRNVINCAKAIVKSRGVPAEFEKLMEFPGVGRKTANVFLAVKGKSAIGVDTHITQISRKLGWTKNIHPHKIEEDLKKLFPQNMWGRINYIVVTFGRTHRGKKQEEIIRKVKNIK